MPRSWCWLCLPLLAVLGCGSPTSSPAPTEEQRDREREALARAESARNLQRIGLAIQNYEDTYGMLPHTHATQLPTVSGKLAGLSWRVTLLPWLGQETLFTSLTSVPTREAWLHPPLRDARIPAYECPLPGKAKPGETFYRVFYDGGAVFPGATTTTTRSRTTIADGTRNTILVVEAAEAVPWARNNELPYSETRPLPKLGFFKDGFHVLMVDGSVRFLPYNLDEKLLRALITESGGETIKELPGEEVLPRSR